MQLVAERLVFLRGYDRGYLKEGVKTYQMSPLNLPICFPVFQSMVYGPKAAQNIKTVSLVLFITKSKSRFSLMTSWFFHFNKIDFVLAKGGTAAQLELLELKVLKRKYSTSVTREISSVSHQWHIAGVLIFLGGSYRVHNSRAYMLMFGLESGVPRVARVLLSRGRYNSYKAFWTKYIGLRWAWVGFEESCWVRALFTMLWDKPGNDLAQGRGKNITLYK
jgi:hypothetical protein